LRGGIAKNYVGAAGYSGESRQPGYANATVSPSRIKHGRIFNSR